MLLGLYCPCQFLGEISTVFVDIHLYGFLLICLEKKEGILGEEADIYFLPSRSHRGEGVGLVKLVYVGESLRMGGDSIKSVCPVHLVDRYGKISGHHVQKNMPREICLALQLEREICPRSVLTKLLPICQVWSSAHDRK